MAERAETAVRHDIEKTFELRQGLCDLRTLHHIPSPSGTQAARDALATGFLGHGLIADRNVPLAWQRNAAYRDNGKIKPDIVFVNVKQALLEKHAEGRYYMSHNGRWIDAGTGALEA